MRVAVQVFVKDMLIELRSKESLISMVTFSVLIIVLFNFAIEMSVQTMRIITPGLMWITFMFAGILGLNRSFNLEKDGYPIHALMVVSENRGSIYIGKFLANLVILVIVELFTIPLFVLFLKFSVAGSIPFFLLTLLLGSVGFISVGTLFSGITINTKMKELLLPLFLYPVTSPVLIASAKLTTGISRGMPISELSTWLSIVLAFDLLFLTVSYVSFDYILEE